MSLKAPVVVQRNKERNHALDDVRNSTLAYTIHSPLARVPYRISSIRAFIVDRDLTEHFDSEAENGDERGQ